MAGVTTTGDWGKEGAEGSGRGLHVVSRARSKRAVVIVVATMGRYTRMEELFLNNGTREGLLIEETK